MRTAEYLQHPGRYKDKVDDTCPRSPVIDIPLVKILLSSV